MGEMSLQQAISAYDGAQEKCYRLRRRLKAESEMSAFERRASDGLAKALRSLSKYNGELLREIESLEAKIFRLQAVVDGRTKVLS